MAVSASPPVADERDSAPFDFQDRKVTLLKPMPGQQLIMLNVLALADDGADVAEKVEIVLNFSTMLRSLFTEAAERSFVLGQLARGTADLEDYIDLARQMAEHWDIGEAEAANREERRTRERRPARPVGGPARPRPRAVK